jgi:hypothetical protein
VVHASNRDEHNTSRHDDGNVQQERAAILSSHRAHLSLVLSPQTRRVCVIVACNYTLGVGLPHLALELQATCGMGFEGEGIGLVLGTGRLGQLHHLSVAHCVLHLASSERRRSRAIHGLLNSFSVSTCFSGVGQMYEGMKLHLHTLSAAA